MFRTDGDPQFEPIEGTDMAYAVNTPTAVIRLGGRFYDCESGVWFEGPGPLGPWAVCVNVPEVIYTIPPRCPIYNVRYVRVYGYTSSVAYVGYTVGYTGCYVYGGTVVYGTGYRYLPWYRNHYFGRPWTWGFGVHYDPWTGWSFGISVGWGQPHGWFAYNSSIISAGWWGPVGYRPVYRPVSGPAYRAGYHPAFRQAVPSKPAAPATGGMNRSGGATRTGTVYGQWKVGVTRPTVMPARPPVQPSTTQSVSPAETRGNSRITPRPSTRENNIYAAPDGKVLRNTPQGWQQRDQNTWKDAGQASAAQGVDRDLEARQRAAERTTSFRTPPSQPAPKAQPAPKKQPAPKAPQTRNSGAGKKKDEKQR